MFHPFPGFDCRVNYFTRVRLFARVCEMNLTWRQFWAPLNIVISTDLREKQKLLNKIHVHSRPDLQMYFHYSTKAETYTEEGRQKTLAFKKID